MSAAALVRLARQGELAEGQKIVKENHGRKILLARTRGQVYATDAHCYHMGGNLWEGDIEDIDGHACVVCPLHRYKIDMATGHKVDTMLDGCVTCSSTQQQRTYRVHADPEFIWIDIPELHSQTPLPSDRYNQVAVPQAPAGTPGRANYGLLGASSRQQEGLAPYSGMQRMVPGTPSRAGDEDGPAVLSQESAVQLSQEAPQQPTPPAPQHSFSQGFIPFSQSRADTASIARRKAATAAIAARSYMPPMAQAPAPAPARGLAGPSAAAQQPAAKRQQQAAPQRTGSGLARSTSGQASLFDFGFTVQARAAAATAGGPEDMDMS